MTSEERTRMLQEILNGYHSLKKYFTQQTRQSGLTHAQWSLLAVIHEYPKSGIKEFAEILNVSSSAVTQIVDDLQAYGFVIRESNSEDKRSLDITLTPAAEKAFSQIHAERIEKFSELFTALDDVEIRTYLTLHNKIISHI